MKLRDLYVVAGTVIFFLPFFISDEVYRFYLEFNEKHGLVTAFLKFAVLATFGEALGLRISKDVWNRKGFGLLPRAVVWGFLGVTVKVAFVIFATGTPYFLEYTGMKNAGELLSGSLNFNKILVAFSISVALNLVYAPVMMTLHKITDIHIVTNGGKLNCLIKKIKFAENFKMIDWSVQWHFIFKKTIPLFWIPAHTVTFLLPADFQVLFAAFLGIALGTILAFAGLKKK